MLIYFSGSTREIERDIEIYRVIAKAISENGGIIVKGWMEPAAILGKFPEEEWWWSELCRSVQQAIEDADVVIAEASGSSTFGVGYELSQALALNKRVLALVKEGSSASYVRGVRHKNLQVVFYTPETISDIISKFFKI